jgi:hypothetical protein
VCELEIVLHLRVLKITKYSINSITDQNLAYCHVTMTLVTFFGQFP